RCGNGSTSDDSTVVKHVIFYDYKRQYSTRSLYYYYERVICPGTFQAEGTVVQNLAATGYMPLGADDTISIS
ncbi:MAG: hypothetical protein LIO58_03390, partial [Oscillospiraceae bacterium]|nr:hypothetical protein [Oscillospiraceae bacterium]